MSISLESLNTEICNASEELDKAEKRREFLIRKIQHLQGLAECISIESKVLVSGDGSYMRQAALGPEIDGAVFEESGAETCAVESAASQKSSESSFINIAGEYKRAETDVDLLGASLPVKIAVEFALSKGEGMTSREVFRRVQLRDETVKIGSIQAYLSKWKSHGLLKTERREGVSGFLYYYTQELEAWVDQNHQRRRGNQPKRDVSSKEGSRTKTKNNKMSQLRVQPKV